MNILLKKKISLVAAVAGAAGPTTVGAQAQAQAQRLGRASENFLPRDLESDDNDRALKSDGDANATAAIDAVPEVASIVNGTSTGGPLPYMVRLGYSDFPFSVPFDLSKPNCGGTLITSTAVLTAAHCFYDPDGWDPLDQVLVNLYDLNDPAGVVAINIQDPSEGGKDIVIHPDYNDDTLENDIALMFLPIGQLADYAQINDDPHEPVVHDPLRVMGWGKTAYGNSNRSDVLLETTLNYIPNEECQEIYTDFTAQYGYEITDGMMCAYKKFTGACNGDSGGPLFHIDKDGEIGDYPTQVGIVSWGADRCATDPRYPQVFTRVSYYAAWIKDTVCSRPEYATKELCGSSKSGKSTNHIHPRVLQNLD